MHRGHDENIHGTTQESRLVSGRFLMRRLENRVGDAVVSATRSKEPMMHSPKSVRFPFDVGPKSTKFLLHVLVASVDDLGVLHDTGPLRGT